MLRLEEARQACRSAISISVDFSPALDRLVDSFAANDDRLDALNFIYQELQRQAVFGEGLLTYRKCAIACIEAQALLTQLRQIQSLRADLWQAWTAVTYQLADMGRQEEALTVAREAVDRFPLLPRVWYDLSYISGLRADRRGKIEALLQCLALSPGWSFAARQLADTYRLEGNESEAMAVLQRAIPRDPLDADNHHTHAAYLWNAKQKDQAIETAKRAITLNPALTEAWQWLQKWMTAQGRQNELVDFVREICRQRAGESVSWMILARVLTGPDTLDERLKAVDSAISLSPLDSVAHDLKIVLLIERKSFDAALAACNPPEFAGNPPIELQGRKAWVLAQQKDVRTAIIQMKQLLETNKTYYWGWLQLMSWLSRADSPADYLQQAQAMVGQFPNDDAARNYLSSAQSQNKNVVAAKQTLIDAVNVAPDNAFALRRLFDAQIKDNELAAAGKTLDLIQRHLVSSDFLLRQVILAAHLGDTETAQAGLTQLCSVDHFEINALHLAISSLDAKKMQDCVNTVLNQVAGNPDVPAAVVGLWMQRSAKSLQWKACQKILDRFEPHTPQWVEAAVFYLEGLTKAKRFAQANRFIGRQLRRPDLPTRLWGQIGHSLFTQKRMRRLIKVMNDWQKRRDAQPWMLLNLSNAARRLNQFPLANDVQRFALTLPADQTVLKHQVWLALDEMIAGAPGEHLNAITSAQTSKLDKFYPYLLNLIFALKPLGPRGSKVTPQQSKAARTAMRNAAANVPGWKLQRELRLVIWMAAGRLVAADPSLINRMYKARWRLRVIFPIKP